MLVAYNPRLYARNVLEILTPKQSLHAIMGEIQLLTSPKHLLQQLNLWGELSIAWFTSVALSNNHGTGLSRSYKKCT